MSSYKAVIQSFLRPSNVDLKAKTKNSAVWTTSSVVVRLLAQLIATPILARLISPEDFGIIAMAAISTEVVLLLGQFGFQSALVQRKYAYRIDLDTVFWANFLINVTLCILLLVAAPFIATFFKEELLTPVLYVTAFGFVITSLSSVHNTIQFRTMRFRHVAQIEIISTVIRVVSAVLFALNDYGVWALVYSGLIGFTCTTILRFFYVPWMPKFRFSKRRFNVLFRFGRNILGESFVTYFANNLDYIIVGRRLGTESLGFYQMAFTMPEMVRNNVAQVISRVLYSAYSRVQDEKERLHYGFIKTMELISIISFPVLGGLLVIAPEFVPLYFGPQWVVIVLPMQLFCVSGAFRAVSNIFGTVIHAKGKPEVTLKLASVYVPILASALYLGSNYGIEGVALAFSITNVSWFFVSVYVTAKIIEIEMVKMIKPIILPLIFSIIMILSVMYFVSIISMEDYSITELLILKVFIGAVVYSSLSLIAWRKDIMLFINSRRKLI